VAATTSASTSGRAGQPQEPTPSLYSTSGQHQEGLISLQQAIACAIQHGNQRLQHRRHRSVVRLAVYVRQIVCIPSSRVQIIRSISSRWRVKCPRLATAPNGPIRHGIVQLLSFSVNYYYNTTKVEVYRWVWVPTRKGGLGVMSLARKSFWSMSGTSHPGGQGGGCSSAGPTVNTPTTSSRTNQKSSRENSSLDNTSDSHNSKKQKKRPSGSLSSSQTSTAVPTHVDFKCVTININRFSEEKWKYISSLPIIQSVSVIILTKHHLSGTFRPQEVIDSGWNIRAVVPKQRRKQHQHRGGVAILYRDASNLKVDQHRINDRANGYSHQAVSWTIKSPLIARPIHITGVYVSPSEGEIEESFHTLTQQNHYPADDIHVYTGDFNAHVADETETHITMQERHTNPPRVGDCHKRHMPSPPAAAPITNTHISSPQRGRLLLRMPNTTSFLILNGRFEGAEDSIPYTLQCQDEATINDYNLIAKQHFPKVKACCVIPKPSRSLRYKSGPPTDHNPIVLHLSLLA